MSLSEMFKLLEMFITRVSGKISEIEWLNESQTKNPSISLKEQINDYYSSVSEILKQFRVRQHHKHDVYFRLHKGYFAKLGTKNKLKH